MGNSVKIKSFTDLNAWKEGHKLVLMIYKISKDFPGSEQFGITNQMRRSVVSITSNIAEGFSRKSSKEKIQFYSMAQGSLTELQNQLIIVRDIDYIDNQNFTNIAGQTVIVQKLIHGLARTSKSHILNK